MARRPGRILRGPYAFPSVELDSWQQRALSEALSAPPTVAPTSSELAAAAERSRRFFDGLGVLPGWGADPFADAAGASLPATGAHLWDPDVVPPSGDRAKPPVPSAGTTDTSLPADMRAATGSPLWNPEAVPPSDIEEPSEEDLMKLALAISLVNELD